MLNSLKTGQTPTEALYEKWSVRSVEAFATRSVAEVVILDRVILPLGTQWKPPSEIRWQTLLPKAGTCDRSAS
jgi:hypothetical protein